MIAAASLSTQSLRFDFVSDKPAAGFQKVLRGMMYSKEAGYGFEDTATGPPVYFSVRVPEEGNHNYGSYELAKCIVEGIRQAKLPIAKYLFDMLPFDPTHPDPVASFDIPAEPSASAPRPLGQ